MPPIDISTITDLPTLKAMAYDNMLEKERIEANLRTLSQRIVQVQAMPPIEPAPHSEDA